MKHFPLIILTIHLIACTNSTDQSDAYGNFEAIEVIVSAEASGKLVEFPLTEGTKVSKNQKLGIIDTVQLYLKKQQLLFSIAALKSNLKDVGVQIDVLLEQKQNLEREKNRVGKLVNDGAATSKQLDNINGEVEVINSRILATRNQLNSANSAIISQTAPLEVQIEMFNDQLAKSYITSPISGTVITKYAKEGELVIIGKPIFKIANLDELQLRAYISGDQLTDFQLGEEVEVLVDESKKEYSSHNGTISWISSQAEFTPKVIQTKEERVNLVYAMKVLVKNDGSLKIGMPGEVRIKSTKE